MSILSKILGDSNERYIKSVQPLVDQINSLEPEFQKLSADELKQKTVEFKKRLLAVSEAEPLGGGETLDDILPEAFAAVREAARRTFNQRHFDF